MRKTVILVLALLAASAAFGQSRASEVESIYAQTKPIIKILSHQLGYKIYYVNDKNDIGAFYVPIGWFTEAGGKGSISYGSGAKYPYFSIYWVDHKFSHIKLFLIENPMSETWGVLRARSADVAASFQVEAPALDLDK